MSERDLSLSSTICIIEGVTLGPKFKKKSNFIAIQTNMKIEDSCLPHFGGSNFSSNTTVVQGNQTNTKCSNISRSSNITFLPQKWSSAIQKKNDDNISIQQLPKPSKEMKKSLDQRGLSTLLFGSHFQNPRIHKYENSGSIYHGEVTKQGAVEVPHGKGNLYLAGGSLFSGFFVNGLASGPGRLFLPNGSYYEGNFVNNTISGTGRFVDGDTVFEGLFKNGVLHGRGSLRCPLAVFTGTFSNGIKSEGTMVWGSKQQYTYTGGFLNDLFNGKGSMKTPQGCFEGNFIDGHKYGHGVFTWVNGSQYQGEYKMDFREGYGQFINSRGQIQYRGFWKNDKPYEQFLKKNEDLKKYKK